MYISDSAVIVILTLPPMLRDATAVLQKYFHAFTALVSTRI